MAFVKKAQIHLPSDAEIVQAFASDYPKFAKDILRVALDKDQIRILESVQHNRRTTVCSGHARGKDYTAAVASLCFLLLNYPSKVISTAPTGRQVYSIMMSELKRVYMTGDAFLKGHGFPGLGGELQSAKIKFPDPDWFLEGFKAGDKTTEAWTGFHSPNILVVVTEASGIPQETFNAIEGLLTGNSRLLLVFNPNQSSGEAYNSMRSKYYKKFVLNCLNAPNVLAKKVIIPGQVDWEWVDDHVHKAGWTTSISADEHDTKEYDDFKWEGSWYRPSDLFRVKVMGKFPRQGEDTLIPLSWVQAAQERYEDALRNTNIENIPLRLGVDVAGMGNDLTVFVYRFENLVKSICGYPKQDSMEIAGRIKAMLRKFATGTALIDTIGEGAGVYSRGVEDGCNVVSVKFSENATDLTDFSGEREFLNMRSYCYWAMRDALDPGQGAQLALPPDDDLMQELTEIHWKITSKGKIQIEPKDEIKKRIGRSPDKADALANTFYPETRGEVWCGSDINVMPQN